MYLPLLAASPVRAETLSPALAASSPGSNSPLQPVAGNSVVIAQLASQPHPSQPLLHVAPQPLQPPQPPQPPQLQMALQNFGPQLPPAGSTEEAFDISVEDAFDMLRRDLVLGEQLRKHTHPHRPGRPDRLERALRRVVRDDAHVAEASHPDLVLELQVRPFDEVDQIDHLTKLTKLIRASSQPARARRTFSCRCRHPGAHTERCRELHGPGVIHGLEQLAPPACAPEAHCRELDAARDAPEQYADAGQDERRWWERATPDRQSGYRQPHPPACAISLAPWHARSRPAAQQH